LRSPYFEKDCDWIISYFSIDCVREGIENF
jgi:hypothetical protein